MCLGSLSHQTSLDQGTQQFVSLKWQTVDLQIVDGIIILFNQPSCLSELTHIWTTLLMRTFQLLHSLLARDAFVRTNRRAIAMIINCSSSVCLGRVLYIVIIRCMLARIEVYCWISNALRTLTSKHVNLFPAVFFHFYLEERWGMGVQTRCDISRTVEDRG